jgi:hypothetical protein
MDPQEAADPSADAPSIHIQELLRDITALHHLL